MFHSIAKAIVNSYRAVMSQKLRELPGYALRRAANAMMAELGARLSGLDLRVTDATVLLLLEEDCGLTSSEIGRILDIQRANMVPLIARLESAGLIGRVPVDRKSSAIRLTALGRDRLEKVLAITSQFEADLLGRIPPAHREHFVPALNALWNGKTIEP